jgi:tetratricopeptide (TPR) repeat protein
MFYLAQCRAGLEQFDEAYGLATRALEACDAGDELRVHLEKMVQHMDVARTRKALAQVEALIAEEQPAKAVAECRRVLGVYPDHPYVLFVLAQACLADLDVNGARESLVEAAGRATTGSDLEAAILEFQEQLEDVAPRAILARAVALMNEEKWDGAVKVLAKASQLKKPNARLSLYTAVCLSRTGEIEKAEAAAREALRECTPGDEELKKEIEGFLPQIPLAKIAQELSAAQKAMNGKNWSGAMTHLEAAHRKVPHSPVVHYYKAICQLQMGRRDDAKRSAEKGLEHAGGDQYKEVRGQLSEMVGNFHVSDTMSRIVDAINAGRWLDGIKVVDGWIGAGLPTFADWVEHLSPPEVMKDSRCGMSFYLGDSAGQLAQAYFYRAVCKFRRRQESLYSFTARDIENDAKVALMLGKDQAALLKQVMELLAATSKMG